MHESAYQHGQSFFENYWRPEFRKILDVGSQIVNGTLRRARPPGAEYLGIDLAPGNGVDLVLDDPYVYPFADGAFDAIVSTSCFEHDQLFWLTFLECARVLSPRGYLYINAPSSGAYHGYPYDHWRFYPDAGIALENWSVRMNRPTYCIESFTSDQVLGGFNDCVMIFSRDPANAPNRYISDVSPNAFNVRKGGKGALERMRAAPRP